MASLEETSCCALSHLVAGNEDTPNHLRAAIRSYYDDMVPSTIFAITLPRERTLIKHLKTLGFKRVATFPRRPGLPRGTLSFWLRNYDENTKAKFRILGRS